MLDKGCVIGLMYDDTKGIYFQGENAVIVYKEWRDGPGFYLAVTESSAVKCPKDEEMPDGRGDAGPPSG